MINTNKITLRIMVKKDIQNRYDIHLLVKNFYSKVRKDNTLGPFF